MYFEKYEENCYDRFKKIYELGMTALYDVNYEFARVLGELGYCLTK